MKTYGTTIRKIRLHKGYSQKEIYTGVISKAYAIEFEKGHHDMTVSLFMEVLHRLNLDFSELDYIHNGYLNVPLSENYHLFESAANAGDIQHLKRQLTTLEDARSIGDRLLKAQVNLTIIRLENEGKITPNLFPQEDVMLITRYLLNLDSWTLDELSLFGNCCLYFPFETRQLLMESATASLSKYEGYHLYDDLMSGLLINFISGALKEHQLKATTVYLSLLEKISRNPLKAFQREIYLFFKGILSILSGDQKMGEAECRSIIRHYKRLGYELQYANMTDYLADILEEMRTD